MDYKYHFFTWEGLVGVMLVSSHIFVIFLRELSEVSGSSKPEIKL